MNPHPEIAYRGLTGTCVVQDRRDHWPVRRDADDDGHLSGYAGYSRLLRRHSKGTGFTPKLQKRADDRWKDIDLDQGTL